LSTESGGSVRVVISRGQRLKRIHIYICDNRERWAIESERCTVELVGMMVIDDIFLTTSDVRGLCMFVDC
jgi:hypothetical protein